MHHSWITFVNSWEVRRAVESSTLDVSSNTAGRQLGEIQMSQGPRSAIRLAVWHWWWHCWHSVSLKVRRRGWLSEHFCSPFQHSDYEGHRHDFISYPLLFNAILSQLSKIKIDFLVGQPGLSFSTVTCHVHRQTGSSWLSPYIGNRFSPLWGSFSSSQWIVGNPALAGKLSELNKNQMKLPNSHCPASPSGDQRLVAIDILQHDLVFKS